MTNSNSFPATELELTRALSVEGELKIGIYFNGKRHTKVCVGPSTDDTQMRGWAELAKLGVNVKPAGAGGAAASDIVMGMVEARHRILSLGTIPPPDIFAATARMLGPDNQALIALVTEANELMDGFCAERGIEYRGGADDEQGNGDSDTDAEDGDDDSKAADRGDRDSESE